MLKEFRSIDVCWDKATRRIYKKIRTSSSDEKGRKLTVQVVNDGQIQDLTNVALNLYWETQDGENRGLDPFEPLDAENGIYELYFRTGMLEHVGKLNAHLHLVDTTGAITSEPFTIFVFKGVDVDAMASDDELSALNKALIEVQNITQDEAERVSAETERATAEEERKTAETARATAETTRNTNETTRVSNETDRVNAEGTRNTNETNRVDAEIDRVTAETARVTAEEEREQGYPLLDGRLEEVESHLADNAFHGILLCNENNQSIPSDELTTILWHRSEYKTMDAFFSASFRSRITIPPGVKKVKLSANTYWGVNNTGARSVTIHKNGSNVCGLPYARQSALDSIRAEQNIVSAIVEVNAGDYFELKVIQTSGAALDLAAAALLWFALEVIEYDSQQ